MRGQPGYQAADVDAAVKSARDAFEGGQWSRMDARDRGRLINKLADLIESEIDELAALESLDNGKPIRDARAADLPDYIHQYRKEPLPDNYKVKFIKYDWRINQQPK